MRHDIILWSWSLYRHVVARTPSFPMLCCCSRFHCWLRVVCLLCSVLGKGVVRNRSIFYVITVLADFNNASSRSSSSDSLNSKSQAAPAPTSAMTSSQLHESSSSLTPAAVTASEKPLGHVQRGEEFCTHVHTCTYMYCTMCIFPGHPYM